MWGCLPPTFVSCSCVQLSVELSSAVQEGGVGVGEQEGEEYVLNENSSCGKD